MPDATMTLTPPAHGSQAEVVSAAQVASFVENGFLHLRGVIDPEELVILRRAEESVAGPAIRRRIKSPDYTYFNGPDGSLMLQRIDRMLVRNDDFMRLHGHPRLLAIAQALLSRDFIAGGSALVRKQPGYGVSVPWHRDPAYPRIEPGINLGVYLDDADEENGMLYVVPRSHLERSMDLQEAIERHGFAIPGAIPVPTRAGDVVVHSENVLHGSRLVRSDRVRRVLYHGCRSIREQLARGLDTAWVKSVGALMREAVRMRAACATFAHEQPFDWSPSQPDWSEELIDGEHIERDIIE